MNPCWMIGFTKIAGLGGCNFEEESIVNNAFVLLVRIHCFELPIRDDNNGGQVLETINLYNKSSDNYLIS